MVGVLRRRLSEGEGGLVGAEETVVAEHVGSAFREWKGERIERLAGDYAVAAFSAGTLSALEGESSAELEWLAVSGSGDVPVPRLRGQRAQRIPATRSGVSHRPPASAGPPRAVDASCCAPPPRLQPCVPPVTCLKWRVRPSVAVAVGSLPP